MKNIIKKIEELKKSEIQTLVDSRLKDFSYFREKGNNEEIFYELCFCLMTANFQAEKSWEIQKKINSGFLTFSLEKLMKELRNMGHRFWPQRAKLIYDSRNLKEELFKNFQVFSNGSEFRIWLIQNVKGLGMKESSHFLRNVGYFDVAIIDKHIINLLVQEKLIERPKTITVRKYLEIENILKKISYKTKLNLGELDLYLWYNQTGKILK